MVSRIPGRVFPSAPLLIVDDVLKALERLGARAATEPRKGDRSPVRSARPRPGDAARHPLRQGKVHAAEASYNNHRVPTLARLPVDAGYAVIEIGMSNPGEIEPLARLTRPHVAMITTIAPAHLAAFDGLDGIATEKASIFRGLEPGGVAVINADLTTTALMVQAAAGARTITFGASPGADWRLDSATIHDETTVCRATTPAGPVLTRLPPPAAICAECLARWLPPRRLAPIRCSGHGIGPRPPGAAPASASTSISWTRRKAST